jgi:hypothetical protein
MSGVGTRFCRITEDFCAFQTGSRLMLRVSGSFRTFGQLGARAGVLVRQRYSTSCQPCSPDRMGHASGALPMNREHALEQCRDRTARPPINTASPFRNDEITGKLFGSLCKSVPRCCRTCLNQRTGCVVLTTPPGPGCAPVREASCTGRSGSSFFCCPWHHRHINPFYHSLQSKIHCEFQALGWTKASA